MGTPTLSDRQKAYSDLHTKWQRVLMPRGDEKGNKKENHPPPDVAQQIDSMANEQVWFKTINTIRSGAGNPTINAHLWDMFLMGYVYRQAFAIRRLIDRDLNSASLANVVDEIGKHADLLTRDVVVGYDGTPMAMDEPNGSAEWAKDGNGLSVRGLAWQNYFHWKDRHEAFDRLREGKGVGEDRRPDDRIADDVLVRMQAAVRNDATERIRHLCNKGLAHADLKGVQKGKGPTYNHIDACVRSLVELQQFLTVDFLCIGSSTVVAVHQDNHFKLLSEPLVPLMEESMYADIWQEHADEMESWGKTDAFRARFAMHAD